MNKNSDNDWLMTSNERYCGESIDKTGLQYLRARYYDPSMGRFLSTDAFEGVLESPVSGV